MPPRHRTAPFCLKVKVIRERDGRRGGQGMGRNGGRSRVSPKYAFFWRVSIPSPSLSGVFAVIVLTVAGVVEAGREPLPTFRYVPYVGSYSVAFPVGEA